MRATRPTALVVLMLRAMRVVASPLVVNLESTASSLDCDVRRTTYEFAVRAQPWLSPSALRQVWDALQLGSKCGDVEPFEKTGVHEHIPETDPNGLHVAVDGSDEHGDGSNVTPFRTIHQALNVLRERSRSGNRTIVLHGGIHFLGGHGTLELTSIDSGIRILGAFGENAWLSGGIIVGTGTMWEKAPHPSARYGALWKTKLHGLPAGSQVRSLFTVKSHERLTWARYPNMDIERDQWGYSSPMRNNVSINSDQVLEWIKPTAGPTPTFTVIDLTDPKNPTGFVKNNSAMPGYNTFNTGKGGVCNSVWDGSSSYWCGNASAGGWAEVDFGCARSGQLQIPTGLKWNVSLERPTTWHDPRGAYVHAWHSQTWAMHMFEIESLDARSRVMSFRDGGGSQGGRNWCRCDQCGYAAGLWSSQNFCGRILDPSGKDTRLIGGSWIVEGVFEELDHPGEFWYNVSSQELWVWPNVTESPPPELAVPVLTSLISLKGAKDVTLENIGFRDAVSTYDQRWEVPSGGDWALHRSGAVYVSDTENVSIKNCSFRRLDGNALMFTGRVRGAQVSRCSFEWIGQNAAGAWGETDPEHVWDGRAGTQPRGTVVEDSLFHDVGLLQKQSSAWFQAKTAQTLLRNNIMYNLPRAAINFNDGFGGGSVVDTNLIFNTCRESGDHGPINSWDRQPFLTDVAHGYGNPSFDPAPNQISSNFIWANYGAAQGIDNDDGSSFYWIHDNVFYDADGFKMDYGGHHSRFERNLVLTKTSRGNCIGVGPFLRGLGDAYVNNTCWMLGQPGPADPDVIGDVAQCDPAFMDLRDNIYGTVHGNASLKCSDTKVPVGELYRTRGVGRGSRAERLPLDAQILSEVRKRLQLPPYETDMQTYHQIYV